MFFGFKNHKKSSDNKLFFNESFEISDFLRQDPFSFLNLFSPKRIKILKNILRKIKFNFKGNLIVDMQMPMNVGGYCTLDNKIIAINPMLLLAGTEKDIAHVLFHEGLHAGIYTEQGIDDEALVETMTKKRIAQLYGGSTLKSGYDSMVTEVSNYFGDLSFDQMTELIEGGDEDTFNNLLELMVVDPAIKEGEESLSWEEIKNKLGQKWKMLQRLFPRIINSIANKNVGPHSGTNVSVHHFKLDSILQSTATKIFAKNPTIINSILENVFDNNEQNLQFENLVDLLYDSGFGYLYDYNKEHVTNLINQFIAVKKISYIDFESIIANSFVSPNMQAEAA